MTVIAAANYEIDKGSSAGLPVRLYDAAGNPLIVSAGALAVDTELPAARAAADDLAIVAAPDVNAVLMGYEPGGNNLDRVRLNTDGSVRAALYQSGSQILPLSSFTDGVSGGAGLGVGSVRYNGSTWDRERGNSEGTLLAAAQRTATTSSADQTNHNARAVMVFIDITSINAGTPSIVVRIQAKDPASGKYFNAARTTPAALNAVGSYAYVMGLGATAGGLTSAVQDTSGQPLPRTWRVAVTHADAQPIDYSVGYALVN